MTDSIVTEFDEETGEWELVPPPNDDAFMDELIAIRFDDSGDTETANPDAPAGNVPRPDNQNA